MKIRDLWDYLPPIHPRREDDPLVPYLEAHNKEYEKTESDLDYVLESKQVDNAQGQDLNRIGEYFGVLGRRRKRTDPEYRSYLKSIIESFSGAGTVYGIKFAVSGGINNETSDISVEEFFDDIEYQLTIDKWSAHKSDTVIDLADLADASVAKLRYPIIYEVGGSSAAFSPGKATYQTVGTDVLSDGTRLSVTSNTLGEDTNVGLSSSIPAGAFISVSPQTREYVDGLSVGGSLRIGGSVSVS